MAKGKKMRVIPTDLLATQEKEAYFEYYFRICEEHGTYKAAWEWFETLRQHKGLIPKFTSYESFKVSKTNYLREKVKKTDK
jgi:hypothetical protein